MGEHWPHGGPWGAMAPWAHEPRGPHGPHGIHGPHGAHGGPMHAHAPPNGGQWALWAYLGPILPVDGRAGQRVNAIYTSSE